MCYLLQSIYPKIVYYSSFALDETVEIIGSVAETDLCLSLSHDFQLYHSVKCTEIVYKTISYKFEWLIQTVVKCKSQTRNQSL